MDVPVKAAVLFSRTRDPPLQQGTNDEEQQQQISGQNHHASQHGLAGEFRLYHRGSGICCRNQGDEQKPSVKGIRIPMDEIDTKLLLLESKAALNSRCSISETRA